jgi:predicted flap endonuclease-1-like 5' DNA nuclease
MLGISTTQALLERGASPQGRQEVAEMSGISEKLILEWVNRADLFRVKGVGEEYSDLLENAGVDTVVELAQRNAANLFEKMVAVNQQKNGTQTADPGPGRGWISQSKRLPTVSY